MRIGKRIKELRRQRKMKLIDLAEQTGIQIATLSRMEHDKMTGTLASHIKLASALGVKLTDLYEDIITAASPKTDTASSKTHTETFSINKNASYEILTGDLMSKKMMPILMRIDEGGKTQAEQNRPGTERFIFVLKGKLTAHIADDIFHLKTNHSLYFDAGLKHWFENTGDSPSKFLSITTPVPL